MNIIICDDCQKDIDELSALCKSYACKNKMECNIIEENNPLNLDLTNIDILFLDIQMPQANGIDIQRKLEFSTGKPLIIFVTNYHEFSVNSHGTNVIGFIEKPVQPDVLFAFLDKGNLLLSAGKVVLFGNNQYFHTRNIQYISMEKGYSKATLQDGMQSIGILKTLGQWENELKDFWFVRINKSCLINCRYIKNMKDTKVYLRSGEILVMSRREKKNCINTYMHYLEQTARFL